jgi:hypothetical protein
MITNSAFVDKLNSGIAVGGYYMSCLPLKSDVTQNHFQRQFAPKRAAQPIKSRATHYLH